MRSIHNRGRRSTDVFAMILEIGLEFKIANRYGITCCKTTTSGGTPACHRSIRDVKFAYLECLRPIRQNHLNVGFTDSITRDTTRPHAEFQFIEMTGYSRETKFTPSRVNRSTIWCSITYYRKTEQAFEANARMTGLSTFSRRQNGGHAQ